VRSLYDRLDEDAVNDVLTSLRMRSTVYCQSELRAPWGFAVRARELSAFHLVVDGNCWLEVDDLEEPVRRDAGDLVLLMTGRGHRMRDARTSELERLDDILARAPKQHGRLRYGGSGPRTELLWVGSWSRERRRIRSCVRCLRCCAGGSGSVAWREALLEVLPGRGPPAPPADRRGPVPPRRPAAHPGDSRVSAGTCGRRPAAGGAMRDSRIAKAIRLVHGDRRGARWRISPSRWPCRARRSPNGSASPPASRRGAT
jgi:hypothetical protein